MFVTPPSPLDLVAIALDKLKTTSLGRRVWNTLVHFERITRPCSRPGCGKLADHLGPCDYL